MLLITYGTRPEWIKIQPLIKALEKRSHKFKVLFTGQHDNFFESSFDAAIKIPNMNINRLNEVFAGVMTSSQLEELNPKWVLVQGDTASVCAIALKYYNIGSKIIHLEAGLRTYDLKNPCPEEAYRQMVSRITSLHLCPNEENLNNIVNEKCGGDIEVVGNTVLDHLTDIKASYQEKVLITIHRRENIPMIKEWFKAINDLAKNNPDIEFTLPIHPNPNIKSHASLLSNVNVTEPMQHNELIHYMKDCKLIITDSGGLQEEGTFLKKKIIVCRKTTERNNDVGNFLFANEPSDLNKLFSVAYKDHIVDYLNCPYGDGNSGEKIVNIFKTKNII